ncbi:MAG: caspase family protein, partial [Trichlorobacter sp.]
YGKTGARDLHTIGKDKRVTMKKLMNIATLLLMFGSLMSGCVSVPLASLEMDMKAKTMQSPADKALLYVYRDAVFVGSAVLFEITIDEYPVGKLAENTYLTVLLEPGKHRINSGEMLPINAEPGKTYYVKTSAMPPDTFFVDAEKARKALANYKLIYESEEPINLASLISSQHKRSDAAKPDNIATPDKPQKPVVHSDIDTSIPSGKPAGKYDVAVVIGNTNYSSTGTPNVDFAIHDAQAMKEYLIKAFGYNPSNIIYIENATLAKMYEVFGTENDFQGKLYKWVKPGKSQIFIYYVGHGAPDQQSGEGYFVPVDANPQYISTSGYKLSTFYENLSKIPAAKKTVVIDACFSGSSANGQLLKGVSGLTARLKSEPKAAVAADLLLTSAGMNQVAGWYPEKGHSLFTYFFLKGIQGDADTNKDGRITMGEMKAWLNDQVPYMARRLTGNEQQPVMMGKDGDELVSLQR